MRDHRRYSYSYPTGGRWTGKHRFVIEYDLTNVITSNEFFDLGITDPNPPIDIDKLDI